MMALSDWLPPLAGAIVFTALGICKIYGWRNGVIGGGGKPWSCRLKGRCPSWSHKANLSFIVLLVCIALLNWSLFAFVLLRQ
jgi:hypothetical protein